ncbi:HD domain-containing protein (plasmid) [Agrobacterium rosae]|uniref:HD domain-containing protein n=1 Tax=Agrobacterium rosae TaxID=1972867 RepID=UPI002A154F04|nr:HD domain-containing protein [Agrobacterium rosae]MDX8316021.1 HD domain-containing protein [Agrobacterium rosae]
MTENKMIKDPIHGFIDFDGEKENELRLLLDDPFFQRLRRVKQLGFSDYVFPSASHSRFSHSLGVFNVAKRMLGVVEPSSNPGEWEEKGYACLAAALLHDIGHGMFSHAFEKAVKFFFEANPHFATSLPHLKEAVDHEEVGQRIILESSVAEKLVKFGGDTFPSTVAKLIKKFDKKCIYTSIVSSQLDADRLDYARRDPYFAGVSSGGLDLDWLLRNLKVGENDGAKFLFVNSKAYISLEQFTVTLFQLYPTIYLHKKTRGLEYMFAVLVSRVFELINADDEQKAGLPSSHPFVRFFKNPSELENGLALDDSLFWGSLHLLREASDPVVSDISNLLAARKILDMEDIWKLADGIASQKSSFLKLSASLRFQKMDEICGKVCEDVRQDKGLWGQTCYYDTYDRPIYKPLGIMGGNPQQINVSVGDKIMDIAAISPLVASAAAFNIHRIYYDSRKFGGIEALKTEIGRRISAKLDEVES